MYIYFRDLYKELLSGPPWQQCDMVVAVYDVTREETFEKTAKVGF